MPRLTLDDTSRSGQQARSAHIAAMGQRLAAAGPRTRQRVTQRTTPPAEADDDSPEPGLPRPAERGAILVADRSHAFIRDIAPILPPRPRRHVVTALSRATALCVMAGAGFALVLVAQSPRWSARQHFAAKVQTALAVAKPDPEQPAKPPEPALPPQLAENDSGKVATPETARPIMPPPPAMAPKAVAPAAPVSVPPASAPAPRRVPVQLAAARPRPEAQKSQHMAVRHEAPHPAMLAHYELPRWLTEDRPTPPRAIIMSPPPHDLQAPEPQQVSVMPAEKPRPSLPPLPRPRLIYASAGYPPPPPNRTTYGVAYPYGYYQAQPYPP